MRSTNIILFLVAINAAAVVVGGALGPQFGVAPQTGGEGVIDQQADQADEQFQSSRGAVDEFVSATFMASNFVRSIDDIVFAGPNMLLSLGAPGLLINPFKVIVVFVVAIDIAEVLSGRILS
jgi:hypothetical protein